jgi:hypothetical protein
MSDKVDAQLYPRVCECNAAIMLGTGEPTAVANGFEANTGQDTSCPRFRTTFLSRCIDLSIALLGGTIEATVFRPFFRLSIKSD